MIRLENIEIELIDDDLKVTNYRDEIVRVVFMNVEANWAAYISELEYGWWATTNPTKWSILPLKKQMAIIELIYNNKVEFIRYNIKDRILERIDSSFKIDFQTFKPPIIISGVQGGGTSIVTKTLRYFGLFTGEDSGEFDIRKAHESIFFGTINGVLRRFGDSVNVKNYIYNGPNKLYFGDNFKEDTIWGFKIFLEENSMIWIDIFPDAKFISVIKNPETSINFSDEGLQFKNLTKMEALQKQIFTLEGQRVFHLNYNKFFTDFNYLNKVLEYCGLGRKITNQEEFEEVLEKIKFER